MNLSTHLLTALIAVTLSTGSVVKSPKEDGTFELLILHNNDMHARFEQTSQRSGPCTADDREAGKCYGGFARVAHVVKEARKAAVNGEGPPVLYLNAGDTYTGTAWFTIYKWKIAAEFINALKPDAVSLGNHELDNGISGLAPFVANLECPVLAANLILTNEPALNASKNLMKSIVYNLNGTIIGVVGYLTPETKFLAVKNNIDYSEEVVVVRNEISRLKEKGVKIFIALGHSGFDKDLEIARDVDDVDLVIGGHTNTFLWNGVIPDIEAPEGPYPTIVQQRNGRRVPVVQAYAYTKYLGKLNLVFDKYGEIVNINGNPILLDASVPQDPQLLDIVKQYKDEVEKISNVVVGKTLVFLDSQKCRIQECNIGNLISDAMVYKYASEYNGTGWTDAPIAVIQGGGIRASIDHLCLPANITKGDLLSVLPFDGKMVKVTINGSSIWKMLEHSVAKYNSTPPPGQFLQVSGLKVTYDLKRNPGNRVLDVEVRCGICQTPMLKSLNKNDTYNILMPSFLSLGGDGFSLFNSLPSKTLEYDELRSTIMYLQNNSPAHSGVENRILFRNAANTLLKQSIVIYFFIVGIISYLNEIFQS